MTRELLHSDAARQAILRGMNTLADAVRVTLGPCGRNVVIENLDTIYPSSTKDGVTVARNVELSDPFENMGAMMVRQVAAQTVSNAGDGTTTAVVLAQALYKEGLKAMQVQANPTKVKAGIELAVNTVVAELKKQSKEVAGEAVRNVGIISANGDIEIGDIIATAMEKVGRDGVIAVQGVEALGIKLEIVEGMQVDRGYVSPDFVTDHSRGECVLEKPYILLYDKKLASIGELKDLMSKIYKEGRPLLVVAEDVEGEALAVMVYSVHRGGLKSCAIKSEGYLHSRAEHLKDLAVLTGGTVISEVSGMALKSVTTKELGEAQKVIVGRESTVIIQGAGDLEDVHKHAADLRSLQEKSNDNGERLRYQKRLARLVSGVAVIKVGGTTEIEMSEKKDRVEDAMFATRCAVEEGVVPGGGVALVRCLPALDKLEADRDTLMGVSIVKQAITEPLKRIALNAGKNGDTVLDKVIEGSGSYGYNAKTNTYGDLLADGVLDPTKVVRTALENASSVASLMLVTEAMISIVRKDSDGKA